jgi:hypothetical protein
MAHVKSVGILEGLFFAGFFFFRGGGVRMKALAVFS